MPKSVPTTHESKVMEPSSSTRPLNLSGQELPQVSDRIRDFGDARRPHLQTAVVVKVPQVARHRTLERNDQLVQQGAVHLVKNRVAERWSRLVASTALTFGFAPLWCTVCVRA